MKKVLLALLLVPTLSFGQISFRPTIGGGIGLISERNFLVSKEQSGLFIQNAEVSGLYWFNNWFVSAGAGYLTTGRIDELGTLASSGYDNQPTLTNARISYRYQHLYVPITVGRKLSLQKFSVIPEAGFDLAYNLSMQSKFSSDQECSNYKPFSQFSSIFRPISVFTDLRITAGYKLTERIEVFCGPTYKYMVTNILAGDNTHPFSGATVSQRHHAILLNAGVYIGLQH